MHALRTGVRPMLDPGLKTCAEVFQIQSVTDHSKHVRQEDNRDLIPSIVEFKDEIWKEASRFKPDRASNGLGGVRMRR